MTESPDDAEPANPPPSSELNPDILFEEYWSDISSDSSIEPDKWIHQRRADPAISSQLHVLSALRNAAPEIGARLSSPAENQPTDDHSLPTGPSESKKRHIPCLSQGELVDGRLRILAELGRGGMGEVYVAWHPALERDVAVKVLPKKQTQDQEAVARFRRSITLHAKAGGHPNIVGVMDAGEHNGHMYLVMEYVLGIDLDKLRKQRHPIPWREVGDWMCQAARGLEHAHRNNLVHRDIKPENLIRSLDGTVKLLDWGLVRGEKSAAPDPGATKEYVGMGTADYMSPEQACDAASADAKSDLYSLGCTFYHLLVGKAPFAHHKTATAKIVAHSAETPPPLGAARPDVPTAVEGLVDRLMEKDPRCRLESAREVTETLEEFLKRDLPVPRPSVKPLVAALVLCVAAALLYCFWPARGSFAIESHGIPQWERLEVAIADDTTKKPISGQRYRVIEDGHRVASQPSSLGPHSAFAIEGHLSSPAHWAIAWIDTAGKFSLDIDEGEGDGVEVKYPASGMQTVNPNDPTGVHLILVLSAITALDTKSTPMDQLHALVTQSWSPPGDFPNGAWVNVVNIADQSGDWRGPPAVNENDRGAGGSVDGYTPRSYLQMIESKLPKGIVPIAGFYLRTKP